MNHHEYAQLCFLNMLLAGEFTCSDEKLCEYGCRLGVDLSGKRLCCAVLGTLNGEGEAVPV